MPAAKKPVRQPARRRSDATYAHLKGRMDWARDMVWTLGIIGAVLGFAWSYVGKPYAQEFVVDTVQDTVAQLQRQLADLQTAVGKSEGDRAAIQAQIQALTAQLATLQASAAQSQSTNEQILKLLQGSAAITGSAAQ